MSREIPGQNNTNPAERISPRENADYAFSNEFTAANRNFFEKMSDGGKRVAKQIYEGMYNTPIADRVMGKLETCYQQSRVNRHERKAVALKGKMDSFDIRQGALDQSKQEISSVIDDLKKQGMPGVESLQLRLREMDSQKRELANKKDKVQSKFESRENKMNMRANKRDLIADKLIGRFNEKLNPLESEIGRLNECKDQLDLTMAVTEARHQNMQERLAKIESNKRRIEDALRMSGSSDRRIKRESAINELDKIIKDGRAKISAERENLERRKNIINGKIAKIDRKANKYRDRKTRYERLKAGKPLQINVETRKREEYQGGDQKIKSHTRTELKEIPEVEGNEAKTDAASEAAEVKEKRYTIGQYIIGWNRYLEVTYAAKARDKYIDPKDFFKKTRLTKGFTLDDEHFKRILMAYYKVKKMPVNNFNKDADNFLNELRNNEQ